MGIIYYILIDGNGLAQKIRHINGIKKSNLTIRVNIGIR